MIADQTFIQSFTRKAVMEPQKVFARFDGLPIAFSTINSMSDSFAAGLRALGVRAGDRIAVMMRNSPTTLAVLFGLAKARAVWVPINIQLRGAGLRHLIDHCDPRLFIYDNDVKAIVSDSGIGIDPGQRLVSGDETAKCSVETILSNRVGFSEQSPRCDETFAIMYTSGTSGPPKGVLVSYEMMRFAAEGAARVSAIQPGDVMFVWEPLYHIGGAQLILLPIVYNVTLAMTRGFSASRFWSEARQWGATHIHYLGGILQILLKQPPSALDRQHSVRIAWGGGCLKDIWSPFQERFGVTIRECYGLTEASSISTCNDSGAIGLVGRELPWFSVSVLDDEGRSVPAGEKGEIVLRARKSGALFSGYFRNAHATERVLRGGSLYTGDLGSFNANMYLTYHGRLSDSVRCKGENVSAWEVEHVVLRHPAVEECAIVGVRAEVGEQDIKLFVRLRTGATITPPQLSDWLTGQLGSYQNPRYIKIIEQFDRTPSHRIIRQELSRDLADCWDRYAVSAVS